MSAKRDIPGDPMTEKFVPNTSRATRLRLWRIRVPIVR